LIAKRIINQMMAPSFRQGDYYARINNALDQLISLIEAGKLPAPTASAPSADIASMLPLLPLAVGALRAIVSSFLAAC
jgi:uncharacterized protein